LWFLLRVFVHIPLALSLLFYSLQQSRVLVISLGAGFWKFCRCVATRVPTIFWYWNSRTFQGPWSCIFKDQFSTEVYSMNSITAIFNICFCDYRTVLVDKNKTWQLFANLVLGKIQGLSSTCPFFKGFQGLEFRIKNSSGESSFSAVHEIVAKLLEIRKAKFRCELMNCSNVLNYFGLGLIVWNVRKLLIMLYIL